MKIVRESSHPHDPLDSNDGQQCILNSAKVGSANVVFFFQKFSEQVMVKVLE
jgi:hypothetical protein